MTLDEIIEKASEGPLTRETVEAFCAASGTTFPAFCDEFSRVVATGYFDGRLEFSFCDGAINNLYGFMMTDMTEAPFPAYAYSVFLAFDEGEYHHSKDPPNASPVELYTKPMIAEIIANATNA